MKNNLCGFLLVTNGINYHLVIGRNYSQFILGNDVGNDVLDDI